ncbi:Delta2-dienoyl-CoA-isomerase [Crepidotus variabilis]|uniref:Delta2-dienoyl-CoA-isomerase n=1 Tax=Crepidotus variabilis TaxID=179855 RepID=A0A9P6E623_9AGAR|nr:Delta2-dienoyl-CoA-isomerase [Crepidotus variabilis]
MSKYSSKWIKVSEPFPTVLHIELEKAPVNAFTTEFWRAYGDLFDSLTRDGYDVRAAVLSSAFPKIFTAGLDISAASALADDGAAQGRDNARAALQTHKIILEFQHAIGAPERAPFPVIVALHGHVIGLGVDIIGACDIRYAASNAVFAIKEVDIGLAPDIGSLAYLPKITGNHSLVRELTYTARPFSAVEAEKIGLISKVVQGSREEVIKESLALAKEIASKTPIAVSSAKHLITHSRDHSTRENLTYTAAWNAAAVMTNDMEILLRSKAKKENPVFPPLAVSTKLSKL